ncbi:NAD(P)/FAD-dependent oxidoreductase [Microbacterium sp. SORGH_AS_0969]|uniref:flavin-containing monooxygenase n=1 Tax=Microbacterium sp. SORGH_AS_0969 TaxID=3041793 RepID=UPI0027D86258|nr:NAD(P)/FAD-dependent oxidoreductase [Microbacterium sp. SORGH_AS_0969]
MTSVERIVDVAIVGAGFAGLAMAGALRRAGRDDFVVLERAADVGGTWRDNTYPGVACDVPAHLYSLAAHPNPHWSRTFAPGGEIQTYLRDVAARERLGDRLRLRTPMLGAEWDAADAVWRIDTGIDAEPLIARSLVLACGRLTEPHVPPIDGLESFDGPLFHSARWDHDVDLTRQAGRRRRHRRQRGAARPRTRPPRRTRDAVPAHPRVDRPARRRRDPPQRPRASRREPRRPRPPARRALRRGRRTLRLALG